MNAFARPRIGFDGQNLPSGGAFSGASQPPPQNNGFFTQFQGREGKADLADLIGSIGVSLGNISNGSNPVANHYQQRIQGRQQKRRAFNDFSTGQLLQGVPKEIQANALNIAQTQGTDAGIAYLQQFLTYAKTQEDKEKAATLAHERGQGDIRLRASLQGGESGDGSFTLANGAIRYDGQGNIIAENAKEGAGAGGSGAFPFKTSLVNGALHAIHPDGQTQELIPNIADKDGNYLPLSIDGWASVGINAEQGAFLNNAIQTNPDIAKSLVPQFVMEAAFPDQATLDPNAPFTPTPQELAVLSAKFPPEQINNWLGQTNREARNDIDANINPEKPIDRFAFPVGTRESFVETYGEGLAQALENGEHNASQAKYLELIEPQLGSDENAPTDRMIQNVSGETYRTRDNRASQTSGIYEVVDENGAFIGEQWTASSEPYQVADKAIKGSRKLVADLGALGIQDLDSSQGIPGRWNRFFKIAAPDEAIENFTMANKALGKVFLSAFQELGADRGVTDVEGLKASQALIDFDVDASPDLAKKIIADVMTILDRDIQASEQNLYFMSGQWQGKGYKGRKRAYPAYAKEPTEIEAFNDKQDPEYLNALYKNYKRLGITDLWEGDVPVGADGNTNRGKSALNPPSGDLGTIEVDGDLF